MARRAAEGSKRTRSIGERVYAMLTLLYPRVFRRKHGSDLLIFYRNHRTDRRFTGRRGAIRFWLHTIGDIVRVSASERLQRNRERRRRRTGRVAVVPRGRGDSFAVTVVQDMRYGARSLRGAPGFTVVALVTLALGIGATTAIFSIVNAILLRPLSYRDPGNLVAVWQTNLRGSESSTAMSPANAIDYGAQTEVFAQSAITLFRPFQRTLSDNGELHTVTSFMVSPSFFSVLGVRAAVGRTFLPEDGELGRDNAVVLSHGFWQRFYGADSMVAGRTVMLAGASYTIVGVMPADFHFPSPGVDLYLPFAFNPRFHPSMARSNRTTSVVSMIARLREGVGVERAQAHLDGVAANLAEEYPDANTDVGVHIVPLHRQLVGHFRATLWTLLATVSIVLLIAIVNVASLLVARSSSRVHEMATRAALGASRLRLIRQLLTESMLLGGLGGALGIGLAAAGVRLLLSMSPVELPRQDEIGIDGGVLVFTLAISAVSGALFGILPALRVSAARLSQRLKRRGIIGRAGGGTIRGSLVVAQVALAFVLLAGAGLLVRSLRAVLSVDPGFDTAGIITIAAVVPGNASGSVASRLAFYREVKEGIRSVPNVLGVAGSSRVPLRDGAVTARIDVGARPVPPAEQLEVEFRRADPGYFELMGIPVVAGRTFSDNDTPRTEPVAIINEAAARRLFPNEDAIGHGVTAIDRDFTIAGVVGDVRYFGLDTDPQPEFYVAASQLPANSSQLMIRISGDPADVANAVREQVAIRNSGVPPGTVASMTDVVNGSVTPRQFNVAILGTFATLAVVLAAVGIYGVIAYSVTERTREIGTRIALGATPADVTAQFIKGGVVLTAVGTVVGLGGAVGLTRYMSSLLFGVSPTDPITFGLVIGVVGVVALLACVRPAARAARVDPIIALRQE